MNAEEKRSSRPERPDGFYELRRVVAANIRNERQRRGWSLNRVAAGVAPYLGQMGASTISAWEASRHDGAKGFTIEELYALCRMFEVTLAHLLYPPTLLDMPKIEKLPGEEPPPYLGKLFGHDEGGIVAIEWDKYKSGVVEIPLGVEDAPF